MYETVADVSGRFHEKGGTKSTNTICIMSQKKKEKENSENNLFWVYVLYFTHTNMDVYVSLNDEGRGQY